MRIYVLFFLVFACGGCQVSQEDIKPTKIAEVDGVTLWKVRDRTPGGRPYVYFTTPTGQISE